ncbi:FGGY-family carbohydrate kinase [Limimaricola cinnabarinus]|uniref:D-ribulokinase n=1 Tax=Limimaricola cinnabarinus LL-001 TaxID=1337093 RepID=U2YLB9_9RHOB|nr:FGGY-family carbohydrate kinase [Limimaricola cinnabarinus]GAD55841.1 D-ribulokinase [Limimaricola cinnabarinus LL-001]
MTAEKVFLGVDVGTGSARAGIFDRSGTQLGTGKAPIARHEAPGGIAEQSSDDIWRAVCRAVRGALSAAKVDPEVVAGIGFDATCSLVVLGDGGAPLPVGDPKATDRDIIVWKDHRAVEQAARINETCHDVLRYVGGRMSPEMQTPKLLWLKENRPEIFSLAWQFFDLTDYLGWRATGSLARSSCTVTCKWTYLAHEARWDESYFRQIGLEELVAEGFSRIGTRIVPPGSPLGHGLTRAAAEDLGLCPGTAVGAGLIDAHAGGIGTIGAGEDGPEANLAYVFGTSSCTMTTTREPVFVPGVWGPYYAAMVPGAWLNEGGQSCAGAAIARLIDLHPFSAEAGRRADEAGQALPDWLAAETTARVATAGEAVRLAAGLHVVPEFLGNRAPHADPYTRAVIAGLGLESDLDSLVALYVAGICGIGYGLRQIIEAQADMGISIARVVLSGGAGHSVTVQQLLADAGGVEVAIPATKEPVLLGASILGSVAAGSFRDLSEAMAGMSRFGDRIHPMGGDISYRHAARYRVFRQFQNTMREAAAADA